MNSELLMPQPQHGKTLFGGIFLIAASTLCWEILLTRIFSATMYYHFVFISISLAMLGFGCSGVIVFLLPRFFVKAHSTRHLCLSAALFAVSTVAATILYLQVDRALDPTLATFFTLVKIFFFIFLPYFFSGLTITLAFKHHAQQITALYCYDLIGAGAGCVLIMGLLYIYDGISLVLFISFLAALSSLLFAFSGPQQPLRTLSLLLVLLSFSAFLGNAYLYRFLRIKYVQGRPQSAILFERWNPINRVTVSPGTAGPLQSLLINYDSTDQSTMVAFDGDREKISLLNSYIKSFYYQIRKGGNVLIIGVGGGQDVLNAYMNGHTSITGIEINPAIALLNLETYRHFNGDLFHQPGVQLIVDDGRNFIRHTREQYDIIQLGNVTSGVASASGAFTFVENSLYTIEAFRDYYLHLRDDGVLWLTQWNFGYRDTFFGIFKILTGVVSAFEGAGIKNPGKHIIIIEESGSSSLKQTIFLAKKTPFSHEEIERIDALRKQMNLAWLYHPSKTIDSSLNDYLVSADKRAFIRDYPFRIDPNTDDAPFFFNYLKPIHYLWKQPAIHTPFTYPVFMFKSLFVIILAFVLLTLIVPLLVWGSMAPGDATTDFRKRHLIYFACLGLGFMLAEIPLIQKFILFLGQPFYAIVVILSSLLVSSGIGSLSAGRFSARALPARLCTILLSICLLLGIYNLSLPLVFESCMGLAHGVRISIAVLLTSPLGVLMGMAFPLGVRILEQEDHTMIPWVWGVNGACSVMGSAAAWGLSLNFGYSATLWAATLAYAAAFLTVMLKPAPPQQ